MKGQDIQERFEQKYTPEPNSGCWLWDGGLYPSGYARIRAGGESGGKVARAHRVSWEIHNGPIPDGMYVCHSCDMPSCVNPDHLFIGTQYDNMRDMSKKGRGRKKAAEYRLD